MKLLQQIKLTITPIVLLCFIFHAFSCNAELDLEKKENRFFGKPIITAGIQTIQDFEIFDPIQHSIDFTTTAKKPSNKIMLNRLCYYLMTGLPSIIHVTLATYLLMYGSAVDDLKALVALTTIPISTFLMMYLLRKIPLDQQKILDKKAEEQSDNNGQTFIDTMKENLPEYEHLLFEKVHFRPIPLSKYCGTFHEVDDNYFKKYAKELNNKFNYLRKKYIRLNHYPVKENARETLYTEKIIPDYYYEGRLVGFGFDEANGIYIKIEFTSSNGSPTTKKIFLFDHYTTEEFNDGLNFNRRTRPYGGDLYTIQSANDLTREEYTTVPYKFFKYFQDLFLENAHVIDPHSKNFSHNTELRFVASLEGNQSSYTFKRTYDFSSQRNNNNTYDIIYTPWILYKNEFGKLVQVNEEEVEELASSGKIYFPKYIFLNSKLIKDSRMITLSALFLKWFDLLDKNDRSVFSSYRDEVEKYNQIADHFGLNESTAQNIDSEETLSLGDLEKPLIELPAFKNILRDTLSQSFDLPSLNLKKVQVSPKK